MPRITNIDLDPEGQRDWDVSLTLHFTPAEMQARNQLGVRYHVGVLLFEEDHARDEFVVTFNGGGMRWQVSAEGNKDDLIEVFDLQHINPDDRDEINLEFATDHPGIAVDHGADQERFDRRNRAEEYFPLVVVWNDLSPAFEFGPQLNIDRV